MKKSGIYRIKNIITGDCYVGSSVNIEKRLRQHQRDLKANRHGNMYMQNSYNKHGIDAFVYNILDYCENILEREQMFIDTGAFKFNICKVAGNTTGRMHSDESKAKISAIHKGKIISDEHKAKMSAALKGNTYCKGRKLSEEHKNKIKAVNEGRKNSAETKAKMSAALKGNTRNKGRKFSEEHKAKISAAKKGKPNNRIGKKHSAETIAKMNEAKKGKIVSAETKAKMSAARKAWHLRKGKLGEPEELPPDCI